MDRNHLATLLAEFESVRIKLMGTTDLAGRAALLDELSAIVQELDVRVREYSSEVPD